VVRGIDVFQRHFGPLKDSFVIIGGTACSLVMEQNGLVFRATKDIDMVVHMEVLDRRFFESFWAFVRLAGYQNRQKSTGKRIYYRFNEPRNREYPYMIEIFSRKPAKISLGPEQHLTPIPADQDLSSLSAILLEEDYYAIVTGGKTEINGLPVLSPESLIPLKARAWLDLTQQKGLGRAIDSRDIHKHKNDVFRLFQVLPPGLRVNLPPSVAEDLARFIREVSKEPPNLKQLGLSRVSFQEAARELSTIYGLKT
jgi:hypothetical protein